MKRFFKILYVMAGLMIVLFVALRISLPFFGPRIANHILTRRIGTEVRIEGLELQLFQGRASIRSLQVAQPNGFVNALPLLTIKNAQVKWHYYPLFHLHAQIPSMRAAAAEVHIIRDNNGIINLQKLIAERPIREKRADVSKTPRTRNIAVTVRRIVMAQAHVTFTDFSVSPPISLVLTNLHLEAHALRYDPILAASSTITPGRIRLTGTILQPGLPDGYLGLKAALGITGHDIPPMNAAARVVGFDLRSLRGLLPPGIATAIGGSNFDVVVDAAIAPAYLRVQNRLHTAGGTMRFDITGTPRKPDYDRSTALFNIITRPGYFLTGTVGGVADAGITAGRTVVSTAGRATGGIWSGIANIGRGASRTVKSAARGDIRGIGDGVVDMTYGTVTGAVDTVTGTVTIVGEGLGDTVSAAAGRSQIRDWERSNRARWEQRWEEALTFATSAPFPGGQPAARKTSPDAQTTEPAESNQTVKITDQTPNTEALSSE